MSSAGSLSGELLGILDGKVRFKAAFSPEPLEMTLDTVARINLADAELEKPKLGLGDVRVTFSNGGQFTFLIENWGADRVTGLSTVLGRVEFQPGAFSMLEFNLTKKKGPVAQIRLMTSRPVMAAVTAALIAREQISNNWALRETTDRLR